MSAILSGARNACERTARHARVGRAAAFAALLAFAWAVPAHAEGAADAERLAQKLGAGTAAEVMRLVRTAEAEGLPARPLVGRAFEGASRGAAGERVVAVVREHLGALRTAHGALGGAASETEVTAGALAVLAGIPADSLLALRHARGAASVVVPLVVMADLVARRVPVGPASTTVIAAARGGVDDRGMLRMRERIDREVERGVAPAGAASGQLQLVLRQVNERRTGGDGGGKP